MLVNTQVAQGDVLFLRIGEIPAGATAEPLSGRYVVAHSEVGRVVVRARGGGSVRAGGADVTQRECMRSLRARRRAAGECVDCGAPSAGARRCALHTAANRRGRKVHYCADNSGLGPACGTSRDVPQRRGLRRVTCGNCLRWARAHGVTS